MGKPRVYGGPHPSDVKLTCCECGKMRYYNRKTAQRFQSGPYRCKSCQRKAAIAGQKAQETLQPPLCASCAYKPGMSMGDRCGLCGNTWTPLRRTLMLSALRSDVNG